MQISPENLPARFTGLLCETFRAEFFLLTAKQTGICPCIRTLSDFSGSLCIFRLLLSAVLRYSKAMKPEHRKTGSLLAGICQKPLNSAFDELLDQACTAMNLLHFHEADGFLRKTQTLIDRSESALQQEQAWMLQYLQTRLAMNRSWLAMNRSWLAEAANSARKTADLARTPLEVLLSGTQSMRILVLQGHPDKALLQLASWQKAAEKAADNNDVLTETAAGWLDLAAALAWFEKSEFSAASKYCQAILSLPAAASCSLAEKDGSFVCCSSLFPSWSRDWQKAEACSLLGDMAGIELRIEDALAWIE